MEAIPAPGPGPARHARQNTPHVSQSLLGPGAVAAAQGRATGTSFRMWACFSLSSPRKGEAAGMRLLLCSASLREVAGLKAPALSRRALCGGNPLTPPQWVTEGTARSAQIQRQCPPGRCVLGRGASCPQQLRKSRGCVGPAPLEENGSPPATGARAGTRSPRLGHPRHCCRGHGPGQRPPLAAERRLCHPLPGKLQLSPWAGMGPRNFWWKMHPLVKITPQPGY